MTGYSIVEGLFVVGLLSFFGYRRYLRAKRDNFGWTASPTLDEQPCRVELYGGPCGGRAVVVAGIPAERAVIDNGVVLGTGRGRYEIESVVPESRTAVATWVSRE